MQNDDYTFKVCIFGDSKVGKTTLTKCYLTGGFDTDVKQTLGAEIFVKFLDFKGKRIVFQIWDFAGEDSFQFLLPAYGVGSSGGIFMFDITNKKSIERVEEWVSVFKEAFKEEKKDLPLLCIGGKLDLESIRKISQKDAISIAKSHGFKEYFECSAKTGENVEIIFEKLLHLIFEDKGIKL